MKQYLDMCQYILENGQDRDDRTGTGTRSVFGYQTRYDLTDGFPLLTTKKMFLRPIAEELLWFIKGDTNIKYLVDRNVKIWNEWPYEAFKKSEDFHGETLEEFVAKIKELPADDPFVVKYGELGPVYGRQWRNFNNEGVDQVLYAVADALETAPKFDMEEVEENTVVYNYEEEEAPFVVHNLGNGQWTITGKKIERLVSMTSLVSDDAIKRLSIKMRNMGIDEALRNAGCQDGDVVSILDFEFEFYD